MKSRPYKTFIIAICNYYYVPSQSNGYVVDFYRAECSGYISASIHLENEFLGTVCVSVCVYVYVCERIHALVLTYTYAYTKKYV